MKRYSIVAGVLTLGLCLTATASYGDAGSSPAPTPTSGGVVSGDARNPFTAKAVSAYLAGRANSVTAALYDESSGESFLYNPTQRGATASIAKVNIVASLLYQRAKKRVALTPVEDSLAKLAIEQSDNDAAEALWEDLGYNAGLNTLNSKLNLRQTQLNPANIWGLEVTTPADQLKLLKSIVLPSKLLSATNQGYIKNLMEHVISSQRFGVPAGVPSGVEVGVKNGWDVEGSNGWQINTVGYVQSKSNPYLLVVMTHDNPSERYGIDTVSGVSKLVWGFESRLPVYQKASS